MTDEEICRNFLQVRNRKRQIRILSDLTLRPPDEIREVLEERGIDPDAPAPKPIKIEIFFGGDGKLLPKNILQEVTRHAFYRRGQR